mmetsp:Transcript_13585/g.31214  ORF Transcript_13585/g.31214 Transcript_13585/m.31214 type:complete len:117 (-) Transcript_13585:1083-1433(-)
MRAHVIWGSRAMPSPWHRQSLFPVIRDGAYATAETDVRGIAPFPKACGYTVEAVVSKKRRLQAHAHARTLGYDSENMGTQRGESALNQSGGACSWVALVIIIADRDEDDEAAADNR